jgi:hypothetical protein
VGAVLPHLPALLLALRDAARLLRQPMAGPDGPLADRAAVAAHEAVGLLLTLGSLRGGPWWWVALRVAWAAGRLYERARPQTQERPAGLPDRAR